MATKVGINGFGRIGRQVLKAILENYSDKLEVAAVNDLVDAETNAHLFKYDTNYGIFPGEVRADGGSIIINGKPIKVLNEKDPSKLPWKDLGIDLVVESTGLFADFEKAKVHLAAGAKKVVISAPAGENGTTLVLGVNQDVYRPDTDHLISNASCTTNCLAPVAKVLNDAFGIEKGVMTTIHSYTNDQRILDLAHKDVRRARAAGQNMIPTSTGAAKALHLVIPELKGKLDGVSIRVPTPTVSLVDLVVVVKKDLGEDRKAAAKAVNDAFKKASEGPMKPYLRYCEKKLVSMDFKGESHSAILDAGQTMVIGGNTVKVMAWYDNEWGYAMRTADLLAFIVDKGL
jgi:glyceraldehyde 3-phosphate dehydrogenase